MLVVARARGVRAAPFAIAGREAAESLDQAAGREARRVIDGCDALWSHA